MNSAWKRSYWSLYKKDMKTIIVVAAVICSEDKILPLQEDMVNLKDN